MHSIRIQLLAFITAVLLIFLVILNIYPITSARDAIVKGTDIKSTTQIVEMSAHRMRVADTDKGEELRLQIADLKELLYAYRHGIITEKRS